MIVKCVNVDNVEHIRLNHIYEAKTHDRNPDHYLIFVEGTYAGYLRERFVEVPVYKVRARESLSSGLVKNQVYEAVESPEETDCYLISPYKLSNSYYKSRFVVVDDRLPSGSRPLKLVDEVEERYRKILTTRDMPGECACGTTQSMCVYHKT